jgi:phytoene dehydrogenase-like protein
MPGLSLKLPMPGYDAIIVGAGHNGLSAAHTLAHAGLKILILEMRGVSGGVAFTEELFPGFFSNVATNAAHRLKTKEQEQLFTKAAFGSSADLVCEYFTSPQMQSHLGLISVGGSIAGPFAPGSAYPLLHRALNRGSRGVRANAGGNSKTPGWASWNKYVPLGGIGAVTRAMERSVISRGVEIRHNAKVVQIRCDKGFVEGVVLESGEEIASHIVLSNFHPAATLLNLVPPSLLPAQFRDAVKVDVNDGCMSKVYLALDGLPRFACARDDAENAMFQVAGFRTAISLSEAQRAADGAAAGSWYEHPIMYGVISSAIDPSMAPPGKHVMSLSVSGSPFSLKGTDWKAQRDRWARHVIDELSRFIPNIKDLIIDYACRTPADLEAEFGLFRGEITHGRLTSERMFARGPIEGRRNYAAPIPGLYFCGVGTWPGNYCSAIPGRNAAIKVIGDMRNRASDGL